MHSDITNKEVLTYFNFLRINNKKILDLAKYIDLKDIFDIDKDKLAFVDEKTLQKIFDKNNLEKFKYYKDRIIKENIHITSIFDDSYPYNLRYIDDPPAIMYYKGELSKDDKYSIAVVGSRKCTDYGRWACKKLVSDIASFDITTVSGLALGIDAICHNTSIENNSRTIGVIGNGINEIYPKRNRKLYEIMQKDHLILSEFPLDTPPVAYNFPRRNRILSGISLATVVIEAKEKSGTLITANFAAEQGKDIFAVPGNINSIYSKGTNKLIQDGAKLVNSVDDIISEISELKSFVDSKKIEDKNLDMLEEDERKVFDYISNNFPINAEKLSNDLNIKIQDVNYILISLELKDFIENTGIDEFVVKE